MRKIDEFDWNVNQPREIVFERLRNAFNETITSDDYVRRLQEDNTPEKLFFPRPFAGRCVDDGMLALHSYRLGYWARVTINVIEVGEGMHITLKCNQFWSFALLPILVVLVALPFGTWTFLDGIINDGVALLALSAVAAAALGFFVWQARRTARHFMTATNDAAEAGVVTAEDPGEDSDSSD